MKQIVLLATFLIINAQIAIGQFTAISSGPWTNAGNWSGGVPTCSGSITITIPNGFTIRINDTDIDLSGCAVTLLIESGGTLRLTNGNSAVTTSITMGSGSTIEIESGGLLETRDSGGAGDNANNSITIGTFEVWNGSGDNDYSGDDVVYSEGTVLPVELINFEAKQLDNVMTIKWSTATEVNNDYFTVEKSLYGNYFDMVATVAGAGTSKEVLEYSIEDPYPSKGISYYRLRQTDFDGHTESFKTLRVNFSPQSYELNIYPNPSSDFVEFVEISGYNLKIFDGKGKDLSQFVNIGHRDSKLLIDISSFHNGLYIFQYGPYFNKIIKK